MADHPLRPATDRWLGGPLPHQLPNRTRAHLSAINLSPKRAYAVLAEVSLRYPPLIGRFPRVTHPCATKAEAFVRLACVRHAASVRSEPGSNSQVNLLGLIPRKLKANPGTYSLSYKRSAFLKCVSAKRPTSVPRRPRIPSSSKLVKQQSPRQSDVEAGLYRLRNTPSSALRN